VEHLHAVLTEYPAATLLLGSTTSDIFSAGASMRTRSAPPLLLAS
jgi:hypothetical protein